MPHQPLNPYTQRIKTENSTVTADDIGIIFIDNSKNTYETADKLEFSVPEHIGWTVNKAYESKNKIQSTLFVSNKNNVKGLEFPFVICVTKKIQPRRSYRNSLFMMMTRSFLRTYLLISEDSNADLVPPIEGGLEIIKNEGLIRVTPPSEEEIEAIKASLSYNDENLSFFDFVTGICDELDVMPIYRDKMVETVKNILGESFDYNRVREVIDFAHSHQDKNTSQ